MTTQPTTTVRGSSAGLCGGAVHLPGDPGYDAARMPWNVAVEQRPAAVAYPADADEVAEVVRAAAAAGLRVAPQGTGHNAGPLGRARATSSWSAPPRCAGSRSTTARAPPGSGPECSGSTWSRRSAPHGLAALHGSSPDVGVVGYSLGGGIGWYARELGLPTNSITAVEVVTADGRFVLDDAETTSRT